MIRRRSSKSQSGATAVEYAVILALFIFSVFATLGLLGTNLSDLFTGVAEDFGSCDHSDELLLSGPVGDPESGTGVTVGNPRDWDYEDLSVD